MGYDVGDIDGRIGRHAARGAARLSGIDRRAAGRLSDAGAAASKMRERGLSLPRGAGGFRQDRRRASSRHRFAPQSRDSPRRSLCAALRSAAPPSRPRTGGLGGFFSHLFGGDTPKPRHRCAGRRLIGRRRECATSCRRPRPASRARRAARRSQPTFFIDVIGDSLARYAAGGLPRPSPTSRRSSIPDKTHDASGLVRDDYYDWPKGASDLATGKDHIDFVVMMFGINDLQAMRDGADNARSAERSMEDALRARIEAMLAPFVDRAYPGRLGRHAADAGRQVQRPDSSSSTRSTASRPRRRAPNTSTSGTPSPIRTASSTPSAPMSTGRTSSCAGPTASISPRPGRARSPISSRRKSARCSTRTGRRTRAPTLPPDIEQAAGDINAQIRREMGAPDEPGGPAPASSRRSRSPGPILSLTGPADFARRRAGDARNDPRRARPEVVARVLRYGEPVDPRGGRADDFSWPRL